MAKAILPSGAEIVFEEPINGIELIEKINNHDPKLSDKGKARKAIGFNISTVSAPQGSNKDSDTAVETVDLHTEIIGDIHIDSFVDAADMEGLEIIRHTTAHVMAYAVQQLFPGTQITIGPVIKDGFYYDFLFADGQKISDADFKAIEDKMTSIIKSADPIVKKVIGRDEAIKRFSEMGEVYKVEIIKDLPENEPISIYSIGDWYDLCRGPHVPSLNRLGDFKLMSVAGAYWRGDEKNQQLTRLYATAWDNKKALKAYLNRLEEAKKRDHRVLGKQLDLYSFHEESPANAFWHPKGTRLYNQLKDFMQKSNLEYGFEPVDTPLMMNVSLWHQSGHFDNYRENMYFTEIDEMQAAIKPMNCPGHCLIFKNGRRSYKDLPVRYSEFGRVHRHERSGVTHGLFRVRTFVQDDAHIFCEPKQIEEEISGVIDQIESVYKSLGFDNYFVELSTRPEKSIGSDDIWQKAEQALANVLDRRKMEYKVNPGDGAFYGPKIDFHLIDSLERTWQCGTVQLDFSMPERFSLSYQSEQDDAVTPVMIHRAVLGSFERFIGVFIEHHAGHFPFWIAPEQIRIVTVSNAQDSYAKQVKAHLQEKLTPNGHPLRIQMDLSSERLGYKIRKAQMEKIPYMIVIGDKEVESEQISARMASGKTLDSMSIPAFRQHIETAHFTS